MKKDILAAFFLGRVQADGALVELARLGVRPSDISVVPERGAYAGDLGIRSQSKASEGAALGAVVGGALGALGGAIAAAGALVVPATGSVLAGPLVAALSGAGALGAVGVVVGALFGARFPELEAHVVDDAEAMGGALVAVRVAEGSVETIERLLEAHGGRLVRRASS